MLFINGRNERTKKNLKKFKKVKFNYAKFVRKYYMEKGKAYISVKVDSIEDIISNYSVNGYEWINEKFVEYVEECAYYIPVEESIILEITGVDFNEQEKETIERVIKDYFGLQLGDKIIDLEINKRRSKILLLFGVISLIIFLLLHKYADETILTELLAFGFWFFCWEYADLALIDRSDIKTEKIEAGQLASLKIEFLEGKKEENI